MFNQTLILNMHFFNDVLAHAMTATILMSFLFLSHFTKNMCN